MKNQWNSAEAAEFPGELGRRVYSTRLLGRDPSLVLHGGGNTSVKLFEFNVFGDNEPILRIKASGVDLAKIDATGFSSCRMVHLLRLAALESLPDVKMAAELRACQTDPSAPSPSVETILHAVLPAKYVDHTHADALISVSNSREGEQRVRDIYGDRAVIVPYVMPGFKLAQEFGDLFPKMVTPRTMGVVLMNHGLISFGETAEESYARMIELVTMAEEYLGKRNAWKVDWAPPVLAPRSYRVELAAFRRELSIAMRAPAILATQRDAQCLGFARRPDLATLSQQGPATPDHVIRTKRLPLIGRDLTGYRLAYKDYFDSCLEESTQRPTMLDPAPRIILDREWGMVAAGKTAREASIANDIYRHTIDIIMRASALGGWRALTAQDIFDVEYWDLEQAKLRPGNTNPPFIAELERPRPRPGGSPPPFLSEADRARMRPGGTPPPFLGEAERAKMRPGGTPPPFNGEGDRAKNSKNGYSPPFTGEIALVTGAASGIGKACVEALLQRGAAVAGLDVNPAIMKMHDRPDFRGIICDLTQESQVAAALEEAVLAFGGLDILILNAGIFPSGRNLADLDNDNWRKVMALNLDASFAMLRECHPLLKVAPKGGRVVVIGSKNVPAPGRGAGAYSASKAAVNQLARVAAIEWGADRIRVNSVHPNMVFDTSLWTPELLESRARSHGMSIEEYKTNNVLKVEVTSRDVAALAAELCGPMFSKTTGAQIPIDGGNDRVI